jgi:hypothetical protein
MNDKVPHPIGNWLMAGDYEYVFAVDAMSCG